jgi:hypothetical protein
VWVFDTLPLVVSKRPVASRSSSPPRVLSDREWAKRYATRVWAAIERASTRPNGDPSGWHDAVASWNGSLWTSERITRWEALGAAITIARIMTMTLASFPRQTKGAGMPNNLNWQDYDRDLEEVYTISADLIAGRGASYFSARRSRIALPGWGSPGISSRRTSSSSATTAHAFHVSRLPLPRRRLRKRSRHHEERAF